ncbi:NADH dehydrogenase [Coprinopsis marcescibilis]|uniref:NADH dehydrogenase n=1 Tax=Coprinopsis marcescibilis TaxID=230819 RepID=A0A5C3LDM3_COPMA|nr:NADH dehydrogenase [Coprinopsis marcescibilis]
MATRKIVLCGAGFLGSVGSPRRIYRGMTVDIIVLGKHMASAIESSTTGAPRHVQISSRNPDKLLQALQKDGVSGRISAVPVDITKPGTLRPAFEGADAIISMVGLLNGTPAEFENIQCKGAENVALAARDVGAQLIHISAIGADPKSDITYAKTKGIGEQLVRDVCPDATIIRPSIVFGPEDQFFNRFARLSQYLPVLPVYNGGTALFQPVYASDIGRVVEAMTRGDPDIENEIRGKILEAGGPQVHSLRQLMHYTLKYVPRWRPVVSLPLSFGLLQARVMEKLPESIFTITTDQIKQMQLDNVVNPNPGPDHLPFHDFLWKHCHQIPTSMHKKVAGYVQ